MIGEVIYKGRVKNSEISFRAIGVGKWGNIRDRPISKERFDNNDLIDRELKDVVDIELFELPFIP